MADAVEVDDTVVEGARVEVGMGIVVELALR